MSQGGEIKLCMVTKILVNESKRDYCQLSARRKIFAVRQQMCVVRKLDGLSYIFLGLLHGEMKKDLFSLTFRICFLQVDKIHPCKMDELLRCLPGMGMLIVGKRQHYHLISDMIIQQQKLQGKKPHHRGKKSQRLYFRYLKFLQKIIILQWVKHAMMLQVSNKACVERHKQQSSTKTSRQIRLWEQSFLHDFHLNKSLGKNPFVQTYSSPFGRLMYALILSIATKIPFPCGQQSPQKLHRRDILCFFTKVYGMHCWPPMFVLEIMPVREEKIEMPIKINK